MCSIVIFQLFPSGYGSRSENESGSGFTALDVTITKRFALNTVYTFILFMAVVKNTKKNTNFQLMMMLKVL